MCFPVINGDGSMRWIYVDIGNTTINSRAWTAMELIIEADGDPGIYYFIKDNNTATNNVLSRYNDTTTTAITGTFITAYNLWNNQFYIWFESNLISLMYFHCNLRLFLDSIPNTFRFKVDGNKVGSDTSRCTITKIY